MRYHPKVTILGAGKVAWQLGRRLRQIGCSMQQVWARDSEKAKKLADELTAESVFDFEKIDADADIFFIAVADDAIEQVAKMLKKIKPTGVVIHCSGATSRVALSRYFGEKTAVLWPIHSFSMDFQPDWAKISLILEIGEDAQTQFFLVELSKKISENIQLTTSENRVRMHLAATIVNNFSTHLVVLAEAYLAKNGVEFPALRTLFLETAQKIQSVNPRLSQTGAAIRRDFITIEKHEKLLEFEPNLLEIYRLLTKSIQN